VGKKGAVQFPHTITQVQREALIHGSRLKAAIKRKIGEAKAGKQVFPVHEEGAGSHIRRNRHGGGICSYAVQGGLGVRSEESGQSVGRQLRRQTSKATTAQ
jgi:hypothetical protein